MSAVPFTRQLGYVLSAQLNENKSQARLLVAKVHAVPDANHVTLNLDGYLVTVPRISSYSPTVGEAVYVIKGKASMLAFGAVGGRQGGAPVYDEASLPEQAGNGDTALVQFDPGLGYGDVCWALRYHQGAAHPWIVTGGAPLASGDSTGDVAIAQDAQLDPAIRCPFPGHYMVAASVEVQLDGAQPGVEDWRQSYLYVGTSAAASYPASVLYTDTWLTVVSFAAHRAEVLRAGEALSMWTKALSGSAGLSQLAHRRTIAVTPLAVSGVV